MGELIEKLMDFRGRTPKKLGMDWGSGTIPALSANNVRAGYIDFDRECYLGSEELHAAWMVQGDTQKNDLVFTMEAPLGNVAVIPNDRKYILSQRVVLPNAKFIAFTYFTEVRHVPKLAYATLHFTASRFVIESPAGRSISSDALAPVLNAFYREKAHEKLLSRVRHWERQSGLQARGARIRHFQSRWASCNAQNVLEFHPRVMELPASVQDYVVVHELCHTVEKSHTRAFWALVAQQMPDWRRRHEALERAAFGDMV